MKDKHLITLEIPGLAEIIDERFDNASVFMTEDSVIYGSALTSLISGLPAPGDLDIAVPRSSFMELAQNFSSSTKWIQTDGPSIPERDHSGRTGRATTEKIEAVSRYSDAPHLPVDCVVVFEDVNKARVQIIQSNVFAKGIEAALEVVRAVDMIFCGIAMDKYGEVIEVVPGALEDCKARVLRLNGMNENFNAEALTKRIKKYEDRGWTSKIDLDKAIADWRVFKERKAKRDQVKMARAKTAEKSINFDALLEIRRQRFGHDNFYILINKPQYRSIFKDDSDYEVLRMAWFRALRRTGFNTVRGDCREIGNRMAFGYKPGDFHKQDVQLIKEELKNCLLEYLEAEKPPAVEETKRLHIKLRHNPYGTVEETPVGAVDLEADLEAVDPDLEFEFTNVTANGIGRVDPPEPDEPVSVTAANAKFTYGIPEPPDTFKKWREKMEEKMKAMEAENEQKKIRSGYEGAYKGLYNKYWDSVKSKDYDKKVEEE